MITKVLNSVNIYWSEFIKKERDGIFHFRQPETSRWDVGVGLPLCGSNPKTVGNIRNVTFSYERLVKPQQSISIKLGYLVFPRIIDDTILDLLAISGRTKNGINIGFDYRYYPLSHNRRAAPDGLFTAAFISYYGFLFKNNFDILHTTVDQNGSCTGKLNIFKAGIQLGYQFLFWKRLSDDISKPDFEVQHLQIFRYPVIVNFDLVRGPLIVKCHESPPVTVITKFYQRPDFRCE